MIFKAALFRRHLKLTQRKDLFTELAVDDLAHSAVNSRQTAEDAFKTGNGSNHMVAGEITHGQQHKQNGQRTKHHLSGTVVLQRTLE